jgi:hypothetical protein
VSIKSPDKNRVMTHIAKRHPRILGEFWTSGSDAGCDGNFKWCSVDRAFTKESVYWAKDQPELENGDCVFLKAEENENKDGYLHTGDCEHRKRFICEVSNSTFRDGVEFFHL